MQRRSADDGEHDEHEQDAVCGLEHLTINLALRGSASSIRSYQRYLAAKDLNELQALLLPGLHQDGV